MASGQSGPQGSYQAYQQPYQQQYQQPYAAPRKPLGDFLKPLVSDLVLAALLWLGLLLACIGSIVAGVADSSGTIEFGLAVKAFGVLFATWGLVIGGMIRHDMEKWVRFAMIAAGAVLIVLMGYWPMTFF